MHMANALIVPAVAGTMYACSAGAASFSIKKVRLEEDTKKVPIMGVMGAFVFATQMINFTIPGTGSSGHLAGGMLLSAILGPFAGFLTMIGVLLIQCLMFADGGILALGCNIWNMAFYGCFVGALCIWRPIMKHGASKKKITAASILGCMLTLQLGAFSVVLETTASGVTELPFGTFAMAMQPIHLTIGLVEGLITSTVLCFLYEARPELLWGIGENTDIQEAKASLGRVVAVMGVASLAIGDVVSLFASSLPDGLEWSISRLTNDTELAVTGNVAKACTELQGRMAILPDYAVRGSESATGTSLSGIVGVVVVALLCVACCYAFRFYQKSQAKRSNSK